MKSFGDYGRPVFVLPMLADFTGSESVLTKPTAIEIWTVWATIMLIHVETSATRQGPQRTATRHQ